MKLGIALSKDQTRVGRPNNDLAALKMIFNLFPSRGVPGEGPDCQFPKGDMFGTDVGPNLGGSMFLILILALSAARKIGHSFGIGQRQVAAKLGSVCGLVRSS
jgi:hypothetical protein